MSRLWDAAAERARRAGPTRNRYVDLLRAVSILVVVVGHWLMAAPEMTPAGDLRAGHVLADLPWTQWLTWLLQVMPVFFFVGGYANAASWDAARRDGVGYSRWLHVRLRRLVLPVAPLLATWTVAALVTLGAGVDPDLVRVGSQSALVPVWFLAVYVGVTALTPVAIIAWRRFGWVAVATAGATAVAVDATSLALDNEWVGWVNYLFVWGTVHQLGFAWRDGRLGGIRSGAMLLAGGLASLFVLTQVFDYPISMVGVPGAALNNTLPPRLPLLALGVAQIGAMLTFERPARVWLAGDRPWTAVVAVNGLIMTIYLWHLTAMIALLGLALALGGIGLGHVAGTATWWWMRPVWIAATTLATIPFVGVFSRFERARVPAVSPGWGRTVSAVVMVCGGLAWLAYSGIAGPDGVNWGALALSATGMMVGVADLGRPSQRVGVEAGTSHRDG
jgi:surface polysaccharide O-acyltransferase-like enzyme